MSNADSLPYVEAELNYLAPMTERPRYYAYEPEPGEPRSNLTPEPHQMHIHSLRPIADDLGRDLSHKGHPPVAHWTGHIVGVLHPAREPAQLGNVPSITPRGDLDG